MSENPHSQDQVMSDFEWPKQAQFVLAELQRINKNCEQFFALYKDTNEALTQFKAKHEADIAALHLKIAEKFSELKTDQLVSKAKIGMACLIASGMWVGAIQLISLYYTK